MRVKGVGDARALAVWGIMQTHPKVKQSDIADLLNQSQGSISRTVDRAQARIETCPKFRAMVEQLKAMIEAQEVAA